MAFIASWRDSVGGRHSYHARVRPGERSIVSYVRASFFFSVNLSDCASANVVAQGAEVTSPGPDTQVVSRTLSTARMPPSGRRSNTRSSRSAARAHDTSDSDNSDNDDTEWDSSLGPQLGSFLQDMEPLLYSVLACPRCPSAHREGHYHVQGRDACGG